MKLGSLVIARSFFLTCSLFLYLACLFVCLFVLFTVSFCLVEIAKMTDVLSGDSVKDLFQGFLKKHSLDRCISIKFGQNGNGVTALNMVAESSKVADYWVRGLHKLIINKGKFRQTKSRLSGN